MAGRKAVDLTGQRFDRLTVIGRAPRKARHAIWACACECGGATNAEGHDLRRGRVVSCGCWSATRFTRHIVPTQV